MEHAQCKIIDQQTHPHGPLQGRNCGEEQLEKSRDSVSGLVANRWFWWQKLQEGVYKPKLIVACLAEQSKCWRNKALWQRTWCFVLRPSKAWFTVPEIWLERLFRGSHWEKKGLGARNQREREREAEHLLWFWGVSSPPHFLLLFFVQGLS